MHDAWKLHNGTCPCDECRQHRLENAPKIHVINLYVCKNHKHHITAQKNVIVNIDQRRCRFCVAKQAVNQDAE